MLALSNTELKRQAPSIFAKQAYGMGDTYQQIPTIDIIDILRDRGFQPTIAMQSQARIKQKQPYTKHLIRFVHESLIDSAKHTGLYKEEVPELVLINSHDGSASYSLMAGIFRFICSNGMIVQSQDFGTIRFRHKGKDDKEFESKIIDGTYELLDEVPAVMANINEWKQIELNPDAQKFFAECAFEIKPNPALKSKQLLTPRRDEDQAFDGKRDLWRTMNVVQENLIKGDLAGMNDNGRMIRTRTVNGIDDNVQINKLLWKLTDAFAKQAA